MLSFVALEEAGPVLAHAEITSHLDAGGDPRDDESAALHIACQFGLLGLFERLLATLAIEDVRTCDNYALRAACEHGHLDIAERLIQFGLGLADALALDNYAMRAACGVGNLAVVEWLLALGLGRELAADTRPLELASLPGCPAIVATLLEHGARPVSRALQCLSIAGTPLALQRRAFEPWLGSPELASAEAGLGPRTAAAWAAAKAAIVGDAMDLVGDEVGLVGDAMDLN